MGCIFLVLPQPIEALAESGGWGLSFRADRRSEMIQFLAQMPKDTMIFTMAVLSLAAILIGLTRLI